LIHAFYFAFFEDKILIRKYWKSAFEKDFLLAPTSDNRLHPLKVKRKGGDIINSDELIFKFLPPVILEHFRINTINHFPCLV